MEVDFYRSLPADITVHTSHIYRSSRTVSTTSMLETAQNAAQTAMTLVQVEPMLLLYGHAASSYAGGVKGNEGIRREIYDATGIPTLTAADATVRCLKSLAVERIWMIAPYPPPIAQSGADFLTANGFDVRAVAGMGVDRVADLKNISTQTVYDQALRTAAQADADAMYICGTGVQTRLVVGALERTLGKPVVTANLAALWAVLEELGHADRFAFGESRLREWQRRAYDTSSMR
jgi:maleate isomerase